MKKIILLLGFILSIVSFAQEKIYVGTNAEFPPFEYLEDDKVVGFDIELIDEIGKKLGVEMEIIDMEFDGLLPALQLKKIDMIIAGMSETEERKKAVSFSNSYYTASQVIIVEKNNNNIKTFNDLVGKKVGVMLGFTGDIVVSEIQGVEIERFDAPYAGIMALNNAKIDALVLDSEPAKEYVKQNKNLKIVETGIEKEEYAMAFRKNDTALLEKINKALEEIKKDGTYEKLIKKYFN